MPTKNKILDLKSLKKIRQKFLTKKVVLCHGVFDLLHVGHINYFKSSKKYGDILVVSVTADKFVNTFARQLNYPKRKIKKIIFEESNST